MDKQFEYLRIYELMFARIHFASESLAKAHPGKMLTFPSGLG
jgi:hypothetical protein